MSKIKKFRVGLFFKSLNHWITSAEFLHWVCLVACLTLKFIFSRIFLLILPISGLAGLISLQDGLLLKLSLWSLRVAYACLGVVAKTLSWISSFGPPLCGWCSPCWWFPCSPSCTLSGCSFQGAPGIFGVPFYSGWKFCQQEWLVCCIFLSSFLRLLRNGFEMVEN